MIAKAAVITHGSNAVRYSADKEKADVIKVYCLPEDISSSAMWARMAALQYKFREKQNRHRPLKNTSIRIEISPAKEETRGWTMADWVRLADEFIREFDAVDLSRKAKRESARRTNLKNSQYVVSLHRDSKGRILHLHINANRIDMEGNVNDAHYIGDRAMAAANKITEQRGWVQAETKREQNIHNITRDVAQILMHMDSFDWKAFEQQVKVLGYGISIKRDSKDEVVGYTIHKGNSRYKSSLLGQSRNLTPSQIEDTWRKLHPELTYQAPTENTAKPPKKRHDTSVLERYTQQRQQAANANQAEQTPDKPEPVMCHHDIKVGGTWYHVDIPEEADKILIDEDNMPEDVLWSTLVDVQHTAILLFAGYIDAATSIKEFCGGGGNSPSSGWGREKDEDDLAWAHRCARMARSMHTKSRGYHR